MADKPVMFVSRDLKSIRSKGAVQSFSGDGSQQK